MVKLPYFRSSLCHIMASRKYFIQRAMGLRLRVIVCIIFLFMCISVTKCLDISSGKGTSSSESSFTGYNGTPPGQGTADLLASKSAREKRTDFHKLHNTAASREHPDGAGPAGKSQKEADLGRRREAQVDKSTSPLKTTESTPIKDRKSPAVGKGEDGDVLKTWGLPWSDEQTLPPSLASSDFDSSIDEGDYYTYDYFEDGDGENGELSIDRSKKDTSSFAGESRLHRHPLDRLAELVAGAHHPQLALFNLSTPNPDIEITIEVVHGDNARHDGVVVSMDLRGEAAVGAGDAQAPPGSVAGGKGPPEGNTLARPTITADGGNEDGDEPADEEDSYSSFDFAPVHPFLDPNIFDFETDESEEKQGAWSDWSDCSASCGGGRSERSRSCGFSCTATESKDCNHQSCPSRLDNDDSRAEIISGEIALDTGYLEQVLDPQNFDTESCEEWMGCRSETLLSYLSRLQDLPNCPCFYPADLRQNSAIWDRQKRRHFRWLEASGEEARLDVYKPTAAHCIISMLSAHSTSLAAQQCCYDGGRRLITRGPGAGTPQLISAEISPELHYKIDIMPWIICKGDWTKYNKVRHPNNMWECKESPDQAELYHLFQEAKNF